MNPHSLLATSVGALLAVEASSHVGTDILTTLAGPAVGGSVAYMLIQYTMKRAALDAAERDRRAQHDADRRDRQEEQLVQMVSSQIKAQAEAAAAMRETKESIERLASASEQMLATIKARPCLLHQHQQELRPIEGPGSR